MSIVVLRVLVRCQFLEGSSAFSLSLSLTHSLTLSLSLSLSFTHTYTHTDTHTFLHMFNAHTQLPSHILNRRCVWFIRRRLGRRKKRVIKQRTKDATNMNISAISPDNTRCYGLIDLSFSLFLSLSHTGNPNNASGIVSVSECPPRAAVRYSHRLTNKPLSKTSHIFRITTNSDSNVAILFLMSANCPS